MINYFDLGIYKDALELDNIYNFLKSREIQYKLYGIEANPKYCDEAKKKFDKIKEISFHNIAICSKDKSIKLYISGGRGDSIYDSKGNLSNKNSITVQGKKFSTFIKENNIKLEGNINIIKINIEGAEWDFFNDIIDNNLLKHISLFIGRGHDPHKVKEFVDNGTNIKYDNLLKENNIIIHRYCAEYPASKNFNLPRFLINEIAKSQGK